MDFSGFFFYLFLVRIYRFFPFSGWQPCVDLCIVMEKLGFRKVCAQCVPHQLLPVHKTNRMAAALDFFKRYEHDMEEMLSRIFTGDETWVHHFTSNTKKKSMV